MRFSLFSAMRRACMSTASAAKSSEVVGFVGLGQMGSRMAPHLARAGLKTVVFDTVKKSTDEMAALGATIANSPAEVARAATVIITMLPDPTVVKKVYLGNDGLFSTAQAGSLFIDSSTIDPETVKAVAAANKSVSFIDAPVSGGVGGAAAATLTFMVGGTDQQFERAKPYLSRMGKNIVHCGALSTGQAAKICNNLVLAASMVAVAEGMNLGVRLGMDPKKLANIFNTSSARCWSSDTYNPFPGVMENVPSSRGYTGGFGSRLMLKDLGLAVGAAKSVGCPAELTEHVRAIYERVTNASDLADKDFSVVLRFFEQQNK